MPYFRAVAQAPASTIDRIGVLIVNLGHTGFPLVFRGTALFAAISWGTGA